MSQSGKAKKLSPNEYFRCPFPHVHPRHEQAFFKSFDSHFSMFRNRDDHFSVLRLHEELAWELRREESERRNLSEGDSQRISLQAWLEALRKQTGKSVQVVVRK